LERRPRSVVNVARDDAIRSVVDGTEPVLVLDDNGDVTLDTGCKLRARQLRAGLGPSCLSPPMEAPPDLDLTPNAPEKG
jgi:hypothetical protein